MYAPVKNKLAIIINFIFNFLVDLFDLSLSVSVFADINKAMEENARYKAKDL